MNKFKGALVVTLVAVLLAACGQPAADSDTMPTATAFPTATPTVSPLPTAPISPISPLPVPQLEPDAISQELSELRVQVAEQLGLSDKALTPISTEQVTWPDASLGCPQPDMAYAQVLTPGWRVVFVDVEGQEYNVHTTENREQFVICEQSSEISVPPAYRDNPAVEAAIKKLVEQERIAMESVTVVDVIAVKWPNSCLGCEKPDQQCLMVITPGYRITLKSGAETYELHTDRTGRQVIICTQPSLTPPRSDS
ncbi:MAG: hypothetical protein JXR84_24955 [Anaerolineae bacterium]|nr:hypothetical protein [Anaerolineae bacterium]